MKVSIHDSRALCAITPAALCAFAQTVGWHRGEDYRQHSNIFEGKGLPSIIIPKTSQLGDYANVVAKLIQTFSEVYERDEMFIYHALSIADRDTLRIRAEEDQQEGIVLQAGLKIIRSAYELLSAAARSVNNPQAIYSTRPNRETQEFLNSVRMNAPEKGSFLVTFSMPSLAPAQKRDNFETYDELLEPMSRRFIRRLVEVLAVVRQTSERITFEYDIETEELVSQGVSANFCEALNNIVNSCQTVDIGVMWARTRPLSQSVNEYRFLRSDSPLLTETSRILRLTTPDKDVCLQGIVNLLKREQQNTVGTIRLVASYKGKNMSVEAELNEHEYERAVLAHKRKANLTITGTLVQSTKPWSLLAARITDITPDDEDENSPLI